MSAPPKKPTADENLDWAEEDHDESRSPEAWPEDEGPELEDDWDLKPTEVIETNAFDDLQDANDNEDLEFSELAMEPIVVGHKEHASLPDHGIHLLLARFSTDNEFSSLHAAIQQSTENRVLLLLDQAQIELTSHQLGENLVAPLRVTIGRETLQGELRLVATSGPPFLVLGRDMIAGHVLVDPASSWLQSKR
jgi:hypothetical protein